MTIVLLSLASLGSSGVSLGAVWRGDKTWRAVAITASMLVAWIIVALLAPDATTRNTGQC
ncbi:MAG: hypothetical protein JW940_13755 [Polyangiaceae bacterium]|nr:hypothetical protein [Polyangiaceae bacterium]